MPIEEKRKSSRLRLPIEIEALSGTFRIGTLKDISEEGMFIQSTDPKEVGTRLDLSVTLPGDGRRIRFVGEVAWVNLPPEQDEPLPRSQSLPVADNPGMGVRILSISEEDRSLLQRILRDPALYSSTQQAEA